MELREDPSQPKSNIDDQNSNNHPSAKQRWALLRNIGSVAFHHPRLEGKERVPNKTNGVC
jgi:hypothetical protein